MGFFSELAIDILGEILEGVIESALANRKSKKANSSHVKHARTKTIHSPDGCSGIDERIEAFRDRSPKNMFYGPN